MPCWDTGKVNEITSRWKVLSVLNITMLQLPCYWGRRAFVRIIQEQGALREKVAGEIQFRQVKHTLSQTRFQ